ncbi:MAG: flavodoxin [Oscillospiraceae bacterium]
MSKLAVVYWSGTGNTETMANAVKSGAQAAGAEVGLFKADEFHENMVDNFDAIAFGCPAMGTDELEETEFAPMFRSMEGKLPGKTIGLFGSYGWSGGEWMEKWANNCRGLSAKLASGAVICCGEPDGDTLTECVSLGRALAQ